MRLVQYVPQYGYSHMFLIREGYKDEGAIIADGVFLIKMVKVVHRG